MVNCNSNKCSETIFTPKPPCPSGSSSSNSVLYFDCGARVCDVVKGISGSGDVLFSSHIAMKEWSISSLAD